MAHAAEPAGPSQTTYFVTGASRGIGLGLVTQLLAHAEQPVVVAAARAPEKSTELQDLAQQNPGRLHFVQLDISDQKSIQNAAHWVDSHLNGQLDVLINNAGIGETELKNWHETGFDEAAQILTTNAVGPLMLSSALLPALKRGNKKIIANVSSTMGSVTDKANEVQSLVKQTVQQGAKAKSGDTAGEVFSKALVAYRASKAALNMEMLVMARDLAPEGFIVVSLHPGWVQTDMGTNTAVAMSKITGQSQETQKPPVTVEQSTSGLVKVITGLTPHDSGSFKSWEGDVVPW